jgi:hypothetical protein
MHLLLLVLSLTSVSEAAGKKRPASPAYTTPDPYRPARVRPVGTKPFQLPNGSRVDLAADLEVMLHTAVTASSRFQPADPGAGETEPCATHLEIRGAVSTLELNVAELGLTFGYKPSGENNTITGLTGKFNVRVGTIAMDFGVWQCVGPRCTEIAAATASHLTAGVGLSLEIDFGVVQTGPSLIYNTPLGNILRSIMNDGMKQLARSPRLPRLAWTASVLEASAGDGTLVFGAGRQSGLAPDQTFEVYAVTPSVGVCEVYKTVAYVHTQRVDSVSSVAVVDQSLDGRGVKEGDVVMVREAPK